MKRMLFMLGIAFFVVGTVAPRHLGRLDPAPNSGDGVPDGSGFVSPNGPNTRKG